jgi:hypothetical protein
VLGPPGHPSAQTQEEAIWQQWLSIYIRHCQDTLTPEERSELASALGEHRADLASIAHRVGRHTARESRFLVEFLANVENAERRHRLRRETAGRLGPASASAQRPHLESRAPG